MVSQVQVDALKEHWQTLDKGKEKTNITRSEVQQEQQQDEAGGPVETMYPTGWLDSSNLRERILQ